MRKEIPELEINQLTKMITERGDLWETILEEQIEHLSVMIWKENLNMSRIAHGFSFLFSKDFAENLFKVPGCILFERNKEIHEKIQEYSVKEDYKLDNEIAEISKNIEKKRAYLNLLKVQAAKLEECKNAVFDRDWLD